MKTYASSQQQLHVSEILAPAEEAAVDEALANVARHCAAMLGRKGDHDHAANFQRWANEQGDKAALTAREVLRSDATPHDRLRAWLSIRSFDSTTRRQQLSELLENQLQSDFSAVTTGSMLWLRRGFSPQAALIRASARLRLTDEGAALLAAWVRDERAHVAELWETTRHGDGRSASEAIYKVRARRDFHLRVVLGIREPHDLLTLETEDAHLALAIGGVWADDAEDVGFLGQGLIDFAYSVAESSREVQLLVAHLGGLPKTGHLNSDRPADGGGR